MLVNPPQHQPYGLRNSPTTPRCPVNTPWAVLFCAWLRDAEGSCCSSLRAPTDQEAGHTGGCRDKSLTCALQFPMPGVVPTRSLARLLTAPMHFSGAAGAAAARSPCWTGWTLSLYRGGESSPCLHTPHSPVRSAGCKYRRQATTAPGAPEKTTESQSRTHVGSLVVVPNGLPILRDTFEVHAYVMLLATEAVCLSCLHASRITSHTEQ